MSTVQALPLTQKLRLTAIDVDPVESPHQGVSSLTSWQQRRNGSERRHRRTMMTECNKLKNPSRRSNTY